MGIPMREGSRVRWSIDWPARVADGETRWSVAPDEAGGLTVADSDRGTALLAGGIAGRHYRVTARAGGCSRTLDIVAGGW